MSFPPICLTIAGFDGSGGAGLQADLKTFEAHGCYGMTVMTALTIQNTLGVKSCTPVSIEDIKAQLTTIFEDLVPDAIKIGMVFNAPIIECVASFLETNAKHIPIVLDPVMVSKSGDLLLSSDSIELLKTRLVPLSTVITPNLPEAYALVGAKKEPSLLCEAIATLGVSYVLLKGGHQEGPFAQDELRLPNGDFLYFKLPRIQSNNTHGTGCTLSAAITANLSKGIPMTESVDYAKQYVHRAMMASKDMHLGKGHGALWHGVKDDRDNHEG